MFSKRRAAKVTALVISAVALIAVTRPDSLPTIKIPFVKSEPRNSLSGRIGGDGPILAVKIDDTRSSHPQIGVEDADIVYIEQVEGGLTRLAAIFSSKIPQRIGPIRSARISDIELLAQFGRVGFADHDAASRLHALHHQAIFLRHKVSHQG